MATLKIPEEEEQRNIIDKLANFVARNGPKFEDLTKSKQKDNPKFSFLFGGDYHEYYKWKVSLETTQVDAQKRQQEVDITALSIQNQVPPAEEKAVKVVKEPEKDPDHLDLTHFRELVQKLIQACTKDNIQNGKNWIVTHAKSDVQLKKVARFLFRRLLEEVLPFQQKLHIVYLANDVLHHSRKRELPMLQNALQEVVLPLIAVVFNGEPPENQQKIAKVLKIWDNQGFFTEEVRSKLKVPGALYDQCLSLIEDEKYEMKSEKEMEEKKMEMDEHEKKNGVVPPPDMLSQQPPPPQQIPTIPPQPPPPMQPPQEQTNYLYQQQPPPPSFQPPPQGPPQVQSQVLPQVTQQGPPQSQYQQFQQFNQWVNPQAAPHQPPPQQAPPPQQQQTGQPDQFNNFFNQSFTQRDQIPFVIDERTKYQAPYQQGFPPQGPRGPIQGNLGYEQGPPPSSGPEPWNQSYDMPPHSNYQSAPPNIQTFDYSHQSVHNQAPGGAAPISIDYEHGRAPPPEAPFVEERDPTIPMAPYYDLPAGLIVPLVKLWDCEYKPVDPKDIRLPIPQPPSERLLAAVEAFYAPPSHDRPRDSQGWEKNGLFEFYKAKIKYIKDKERKLELIERSPSPAASLSPAEEEEGEPLVTSKPSTMRSPSRSPRPNSRSRSRSGSRERKGSRSKSRSRSRTRSRSRSRSRSTSRSPRKKGSRSRSRSYSRSKSRSPQKDLAIIKQKSPTPPAEFVMFETKTLDSRIEESNVGHKMMMKMGWGGQGLGKSETGIVDPIKQDGVRQDKQDKFKGIGMDINDPFESYRKNKSYTYSRPRERRK